MKKYLLLVALVLGGGFYLHATPPRPVIKTTAPKTTQQAKPKLQGVGDTQNIGDMNVTLNRVFSVSPTVFGVDISTDYSGVLDPQFIPKGAWLYTSDGKYVHSSSVEGTTAYFTIPPNVYVDTFLFYNFRWYL